jgi:hypothetical protein
MVRASECLRSGLKNQIFGTTANFERHCQRWTCKQLEKYGKGASLAATVLSPLLVWIITSSVTESPFEEKLTFGDLREEQGVPSGRLISKVVIDFITEVDM